MKLLLMFVCIGLRSIAFGQDTCFVTVKYGDNPDSGHFAFLKGIRIYYETYWDRAKQPLL